MNVDAVFEHLGNFGKFQLFSYILACIPSFALGFVLMAPVFILATPKFRCFIPECDENPLSPSLNFDSSLSSKSSECSHLLINTSISNQSLCVTENLVQSKVICNRFIYEETEFKNTFVTEFNLVCNSEWKVPLAQSLLMVGDLVGIFIWGLYADRFGRKSIFYFCPLIACLAALAGSFSQDYVVFSSSMFILVMALTGPYAMGFVMSIEQIGAKWRVWCGNGIQIVFSFGELAACLFAYFINDWRQLEIILAVISGGLIITSCFITESMRWQISNGQLDNALKTAKKAARWNDVVIPHEILCSKEISSSSSEMGSSQIFKNSIIRRWSLNLFFCWAVHSLIYYGLNYEAQAIGSSIGTYAAGAALALSESPFIVAITFLMQYFGRKKVLFSTMTICGLACILSSFLPSSLSWLTTVLAVLGKGCVAGSFALIFVFASEIFPTVIRSSGIGLCSTFSKMGGILAPQFTLLKFAGPKTPLLVFGVFALIAALLSLDLPETHEKSLPESIEDTEKLKKRPRESIF